MTWEISHRADARAAALADRHYSRQKIGSPQFVPPGRCLVLWQPKAYWVTSWPFAEWVRHAWAGAWVCSAFRNEGAGLSSELIIEAVAATRWRYPEVPALGMVTFVDPGKVPVIRRRGNDIYGYCFRKAGWDHIGCTKGGLWTWQLTPDRMPEPAKPLMPNMTPDLFQTLDDSAVPTAQDRPLHSDGGTTDSGLRAEPLHRGPVFSTWCGQ